MRRVAAFVVAAILLLPSATVSAGSRCYGTTGKGRLEQGVRLPERGANYAAYSQWGVGAGRTYVHSKVAEIMLGAYSAIDSSHPTVVYVYGETGHANGGNFYPHRTHQNGLSVDFFVPVLEPDGRSVPFPSSMVNRFGYDIEFDREGIYGEYRIDFAALAEHLYQLDRAAKAAGAKLGLVIVDPAFLPKLFATTRGGYLKTRLPFMKGKPWVRHDEHYHVDFAVPCGRA